MSRSLPGLAVMAGLLVLSGCAATYTVNVNSIRAPVVPPARDYVIRSGMKGTGEGDLVFKEFSTYVRRALARRGYSAAEDPGQAALVVLLSYDMIPAGSAHETRYATYYIPSTYRHHGRYIVESSSRSEPRFYAAMMLKGLAGSAYRKGTEEQFWQTRATLLSPHDNLRALFPVLVAGAMPHIGSETKEQVVSFISVKDESFLYVTGKAGAEP